MKVVIIGNGISGVTAARHIRKLSDAPITLISDESPYFFSRTALMYVFMGHLRLRDTEPYERTFWSDNRINRLQARVMSVDYQRQSVTTQAGAVIPYDCLILATGSLPVALEVPGENLQGVHYFYHLKDWESLEQQVSNLQGRAAVLAGGGLVGIELAEMLHSRNIPLSYLVRETSFGSHFLPPEESEMINRRIRAQRIDLRLNTYLTGIETDARGQQVAAVVTNRADRLPCGLVAVGIGVRPQIDFLKNGALHTDKGVLVDGFLKTNQPHVYAIGDCAQLSSPMPGRRATEAVWYCGRMMGEAVARTVCGEPTPYNPGIWFNSAKFFDIEHQVYGRIDPLPPPTESSLYWEHVSGKRSIRLQYNLQSRAVVGINLMGIRYRQAVCTKWIAEETPLERVLTQLSLARFDPEFYEGHESAMLAAYNRQQGTNLKPEKNQGLRSVLRFLTKKTP